MTVGPGSALEKSALIAERVHWISGEAPRSPIEVAARVRSRQADVNATVTMIDRDRATVTFAHKLRAIAPGQAVVLYDGDEVLGSATIASTRRAG